MIEKLAKSRRAAGAGYEDVGEKLASFAATEVYGPLANGWKRLARMTKIMGDLQSAMVSLKEREVENWD